MFLNTEICCILRTFVKFYKSIIHKSPAIAKEPFNPDEMQPPIFDLHKPFGLQIF